MRIRFDDVEVVDKKAEMTYTGSLFKFAMEMQKKPLQIRPVQVKIATVPAPKY